MDMTRHASARSQQRGIPPLVIDLLLGFGSREPAGDGTAKVFFDRRARRRLGSYAGAVAHNLDDHLDVYALVDAHERVITVAHRTQRIHRS